MKKAGVCLERGSLTVEQIEAREVVAGPLDAVLTLPLGHPNAAWRICIANSGANDEIWSFTARWQTKWGRKEV